MPSQPTAPLNLTDLFPTRLATKKPYWTKARGTCKCYWCGDEIYDGEKVVVAIPNKQVYCAECGLDSSTTEYKQEQPTRWREKEAARARAR